MRSSRRRFLGDAGRALGLLGLAAVPGCSRSPGDGLLEQLGFASADKSYEGGFVGQRFDRGHLLREASQRPVDATARTGVVIVGAGIAGLAAARGLQRSGVEDYRLFELEDEPGGNSRGGKIAGFDCPWGAHYLPTPSEQDEDVAELLTEYGLRRSKEGQIAYDEMQLCHSPQERLFIGGGWQEGLLPVRGQGQASFDDYRRFAALIHELERPGRFAIPTAASAWDAELAALDARTFADWLDAQGLRSPALRWYLDYCCRDDYGAGLSQVSAWAGLHYFASRHGFSAPDDAESAKADAASEGVLAWPEGNAWLSRRMAAPHADRTRCGSLVLRVEEGRNEVAVDVLDLGSGRLTRWLAARAIVCAPLFVATRLLVNPSDALRQAATALPHAPWLVANLHVDARLSERRGNAPLSWDNVLYGSAGLGYVDAMHQSTRPYAGPTVLTWYMALGDNPAAGRQLLKQRDWQNWCEWILNDLSVAHPDLRGKVRRIELMRYGHAMAIPAPGLRGHPALAALRKQQGRVIHAHADLSAYSIFEEAYHWGLGGGRKIAHGLAA